MMQSTDNNQRAADAPEAPQSERQIGYGEACADLQAKIEAGKTYSAPAMERRIEGWPFGRFQRCTAVFKIEQHPTRGERCVRVITDAEGRSYAPKKLTYSDRVRIVEGSDGRTYVAELTRSGFVSIMQSNMKFQEESIHERDARFPAVRALFVEASANE